MSTICSRPLPSGLSYSSARPPLCIGLSIHTQEGLVELLRIVKHRLGDLILRPGNRARIRVHLIGAVAPKGLQTVARRIEEVDGGAARDTVTAGAVVDAHLMHGQNIRGAKQRIRRIHHEGRMMEPSGPAWNNGEIVRSWALPEPGCQWGAIRTDEHLAGP